MPAQVYNQWEHLVDQQMANGLETNVVASIAAGYLAPGAVDNKVRNVSKRYYVASGGLAVTKPRLAARRSRSQIPSWIEVGSLKAAAESRANGRLRRRRPSCRQFRNRNVCNYSEPVGLMAKRADSRFAGIR
jgi:hypothetical protein